MADLELCPISVNVCFTRGDTTPFTFTLLVAEGGAPINITGSTFLLTVDPSPEPIDASGNLFQLTGTIINGPGGVVQFQMTALQANQVGTLFYDVQWTNASAVIRTIIKGEMQFSQDITK